MSTIGTYNYPDLFAGDFPLVTEPATVLSGEGVLSAGSIMGKVTATGKLRHIAANGDGSENVFAILSEDVDATAADVETIVFLTGEFNENALSVGDSTVAARKVACRQLSIFQKSVIKQDGTPSS